MRKEGVVGCPLGYSQCMFSYWDGTFASLDINNKMGDESHCATSSISILHQHLEECFDFF